MQHVQAVHAARVVVIEPRAEHPRGSQLAPVFMRNDVIRIVGPCAVIAEIAQRSALRKSTHQHAVPAIGKPGGAAEHVIHVAACQLSSLSDHRIVNARVRRNLDLRRVQFGEVHLHGVVPERVIERRPDDLRARRHFWIRRRIELDLIQMAGWIRHAEARLQSGGFAAAHLPPVERDRVMSIGTADEFGRRERTAADAVDEPARVGHFIDRVHVARPNVMPLHGTRKRVRHEIVEVGILDRPDLRRVQRHVIVDGDRIVRIERRRLRRQGLYCQQQREKR